MLLTQGSEGQKSSLQEPANNNCLTKEMADNKSGEPVLKAVMIISPTGKAATEMGTPLAKV